MQKIKRFSANTPAQANTLLQTTEHAARGMSEDVNSDELDFLRFKENRAIFTLHGKILKFVNQNTYLGGSI